VDSFVEMNSIVDCPGDLQLEDHVSLPYHIYEVSILQPYPIELKMDPLPLLLLLSLQDNREMVLDD